MGLLDAWIFLYAIYGAFYGVWESCILGSWHGFAVSAVLWSCLLLARRS